MLNLRRVTGAPGEIRTPDLTLRRRSLYPAELRARCVDYSKFQLQAVSRDGLAIVDFPEMRAEMKRRINCRTNPSVFVILTFSLFGPKYL